eukprot:m.465754 g.465754  ORF g.465754 m.465754 type:complete len:55 (-) comp24504_c0_seq1:456-620(-)
MVAAEIHGIDLQTIDAIRLQACTDFTFSNTQGSLFDSDSDSLVRCVSAPFSLAD